MSGWGPDTYPAPMDGWVCFHCGIRFTRPNAARDHFGLDPDSMPSCLLSPEHVGSELRRFRAVEGDLRPIISSLITLREMLDGAPPTGADADTLYTLCHSAIEALSPALPPPRQVASEPGRA